MEDKINELEKQLKESAERRKIFKEEGNVEEEAKENSRFAELTEKIYELKEEEKREIERQAKIAKLEKELRESAKRRKTFKEEGNIEGEAQENSRYAYLTEKLAEAGVEEDFSLPINAEEKDIKEEKSISYIERVKGFAKKIGEKINKFIGKIKEKVKSVFNKSKKLEEIDENEEKSTIDKKTIEFREALKAKENSKTSMRSIDIAADAIIKPLDKNDGLEK